MAYFIPRDPNERHIHLNLIVRQFDTMLYPTLVFFFFGVNSHGQLFIGICHTERVFPTFKKINIS